MLYTDTFLQSIILYLEKKKHLRLAGFSMSWPWFFLKFMHVQVSATWPLTLTQFLASIGLLKVNNRTIETPEQSVKYVQS